ncbi:MAG: response regulator transcription factor [Candidatus Sulfotelmatobacter sp.]
MANMMTVPNQLRPRVLAADSTPMTTQLLVEALARDAQFQMIESPSDATALLAFVKKEQPRIAVISAKFGEPSVASFDLVREIRLQSPGTRVIMLLDSSERAGVIEAFRAGAQGVFCRTEPFRLLAKCIQCVDNGQVWANSTELQFVLQALAQPPLANCLNLSGGILSARETDVVRCVAEGLTNREIAQRLKLTEHTVKNYLFRIFDKLGVSSRVEVVLYAFRNGTASHTSPLPSSRRTSQSVAALPRVMAKIPVTIRTSAT